MQEGDSMILPRPRYLPSGSIPSLSADLTPLRITPWSDGECNQSAEGRDSIPQFFTRSKSADTVIAHELPFMRTTSSSEILGKSEKFEWDDPHGMKTTTAFSNKRSIMGMVGRLKVFTNPKMGEGAKLDSNASSYIKVLCRFSDGENEVLFLSFIRNHKYDNLYGHDKFLLMSTNL